MLEQPDGLLHTSMQVSGSTHATMSDNDNNNDRSVARVACYTSMRMLGLSHAIICDDDNNNKSIARVVSYASMHVLGLIHATVWDNDNNNHQSAVGVVTRRPYTC